MTFLFQLMGTRTSLTDDLMLTLSSTTPTNIAAGAVGQPRALLPASLRLQLDSGTPSFKQKLISKIVFNVKYKALFIHFSIVSYFFGFLLFFAACSVNP